MKSTFYRAQRASAAPQIAVFSLSVSLVVGAAYAAGNGARTPAIVALSAPDLYFLNRITWGATPSSAQELIFLGTEKFLDRQLHPVTVGTAVASRPPHGSRHALLTHRALPSGSGVETVTGQRV